MLAVQESSDEAEIVVEVPSKASSSKATPLKPVLAPAKAVVNIEDLLYGSSVSPHWEKNRTMMQQAISQVIRDFMPTNMPDQQQWRSYGRWLHEANALSMLDERGKLLVAAKKAAEEIKANTEEIKFFVYEKLEETQDEEEGDAVPEGTDAVDD